MQNFFINLLTNRKEWCIIISVKGRYPEQQNFILGGFQYENSKGTFKRKQQQVNGKSRRKAHRHNEIFQISRINHLLR